MRRYTWLAHSRPMRHLPVAWCACYAGDLAALTAASVYAYHTGGAGLSLIAIGVLLVVVAVVFWPSPAHIDSRIAGPGPDVDLLRQVAFFRPLPFALIEHLATELQPATFEPGDVIIREREGG